MSVPCQVVFVRGRFCAGARQHQRNNMLLELKTPRCTRGEGTRVKQRR